MEQAGSTPALALMPDRFYPTVNGLLPIPERESDCSGVRPSWYPFQINVCDDDEPDPPELSERHFSIPDPEAP